MKEFTGKILYKGFRLEVQFCAENLREASKILNQSRYQVKEHFTYISIQIPYSEIQARGTNTITTTILSTDMWIPLNEAQKKIKEHLYH